MTQATQVPSLTDDSAPKARTIAGRAYAAKGAASPLGPFTFTRRSPRAQDVQIEILYCGVCHSDLHQARDEWKSIVPTVYPCVPGHEIVGRVVKVGSAVKKFKEGDLAAVGCMVDSCGKCSSCQAGEEQYCLNFATYTYNAPDKVSGGVTYGGYSDGIVVDERFVLRVPTSLDPAGVASSDLRECLLLQLTSRNAEGGVARTGRHHRHVGTPLCQLRIQIAFQLLDNDLDLASAAKARRPEAAGQSQ